MSIHSSAIIHPTAIIEEGAVIGENVFVGPFCLIGDAVVIKKNTRLKSHVVVSGDTEIGSDNEIYPFVTIGEVNQDLKYKGENTKTLIGNHNRIRESVTIHRGSAQGGGITQIGNDNLLMVGAHIAHDCIVGNANIFANNATLGGHVHIANQVIVGGLTAIHQFCTVGEHVMIGGCSGVVKDVPPYCVAQGNHAKPFGINKIGLKRHGFSQEQTMAIYECYKILYRSDLSLEQAQAAIAKLAESHEELAVYPAFFAQSTRGIIR